MTFYSMLFERAEDRAQGQAPQEPPFFADLNLDQVIEAVTAGRGEYDLKPLFYASLHDVAAIAYRHEVMRDLENTLLHRHIELFARSMHEMREHLAQAERLHYHYQQAAWFLSAVEVYCAAVSRLAAELASAACESRGFLRFRDYMAAYAVSGGFTALTSETQRLQTDLASVRYCLLIDGACVQVRKYAAEVDYSAAVEATFAKFKQGAARDYRTKFPSWPEMNQLEARILDFVAQLYPDVFARLDAFCARNRDYLDETVQTFDREVQFYIAYLEYIAGLQRAGLKFCYPRISDTDRTVYDYDGFDIALASKRTAEGASVVCNDFYLRDEERIFVVTGPNQSGKTTFARMFGQLHYLASIGCLVPGSDAQLFLFDRLFTHFEKAESIETLRGKLQDDLVRIYAILTEATPNSIIILNEIFTSTTLEDAVFLSKRIMARIVELDLLCVCVTFLDELAAPSRKIVSVVSTVVPEHPTLRTYKIVRSSADGLAYALSIAEKYGLTYARLRERLQA